MHGLEFIMAYFLCLVMTACAAYGVGAELMRLSIKLQQKTDYNTDDSKKG